jgi:hypothetical protein
MKYSVIVLCSAHLLMDGIVSVMTQSFHTTKNTKLIGFAGDKFAIKTDTVLFSSTVLPI